MALRKGMTVRRRNFSIHDKDIFTYVGKVDSVFSEVKCDDDTVLHIPTEMLVPAKAQ